MSEVNRRLLAGLTSSGGWNIPIELAEKPIELADKHASEVCERESAIQIASDYHLYSLQKGGALGTEQLRMLQARLTELQIERPFKHLLITSAVHGEGKTHMAANLAVTLAADGHSKVLLIDMDVRNSSVHLACGIPNSLGLKDWLLNGGSPWEVVQKIKGTNLYVMTGGAATLESLGPTQISRIQALIDQFGPEFDLILLDSPPVLGAVDTKLLGTLADAVLIVVKAGSTPRRLVSQAQESLKGENILGVVLNRINPTQGCFATFYHYSSLDPSSRASDE